MKTSLNKQNQIPQNFPYNKKLPESADSLVDNHLIQ